MSRDLRNNIKGSLERQEILTDLIFTPRGATFPIYSLEILAVLKT